MTKEVNEQRGVPTSGRLKRDAIAFAIAWPPLSCAHMASRIRHEDETLMAGMLCARCQNVAFSARGWKVSRVNLVAEKAGCPKTWRARPCQRQSSLGSVNTCKGASAKVSMRRKCESGSHDVDLSDGEDAGPSRRRHLGSGRLGSTEIHCVQLPARSLRTWCRSITLSSGHDRNLHGLLHIYYDGLWH